MTLYNFEYASIHLGMKCNSKMIEKGKLISTVIIIIIIILSVATFLAVPSLSLSPSPSSSDLSLSHLTSQGSPHQGTKSAPVTVIDFSDLQCHLCARYVKNTEPKINETYIQTGKVALVFKHLPNRGFDSMPAAIAAQCTQDQGKFWQFHNLLYEKQGPIDSGWANKENLKKLASQISGLEMQKFDSCFDSQKYKSFVENDITLAHSFGFTETPSFIVVKSDGSNPQKIEGPQPFPAFKAVIDKELGGA
jgi:protein-disulfide isomerase